MRALAVLVASAVVSLVVDASALAATMPGHPPSAARVAPSALSGRAGLARAVLGEAPLPRAAQPIASAPAGLRQPFETPGVDGLVDLHRFYATPEAPDAVERDIAARLPHGAAIAGSGSFGGPSSVGTGFVVDLATASPHDDLAELIYAVVARASGAAVRIDADSVWEPSRPSDEILPTSARAELTGFRVITLARGDRGSTSTRIGVVDTRRLVGALNRLPVGPAPSCLERAVVFSLTLTTPHGDVYRLSDVGCANAITVEHNGSDLPVLVGDCRLSTLVAKLVPARARATRHSLSADCTPS